MPTGPDGKPVERVTISPWAEGRLDIPMIAVEGRNHASLIADPDDGMVNLLVDFLKLGNPGAETHEAWLQRAQQYGAEARKKMLVNPGKGAAGVEGEFKKFFGHVLGEKPEELMEGWQQFVVHAMDERGDAVPDYIVGYHMDITDYRWATKFYPIRIKKRSS